MFHERILKGVLIRGYVSSLPSRIVMLRHASYIRVVKMNARIRGVMKGYCGNNRHDRMYHHERVLMGVLIRGYVSSLPVRHSAHCVSSEGSKYKYKYMTYKVSY